MRNLDAAEVGATQPYASRSSPRQVTYDLAQLPASIAVELRPHPADLAQGWADVEGRPVDFEAPTGDASARAVPASSL